MYLFILDKLLLLFTDIAQSTFESNKKHPHERVFYRVAINTILDISMSEMEWKLE